MKLIPICSAILILLATCSAESNKDNGIIKKQPFNVSENGITSSNSFLTCEGDTVKNTSFFEGQTFTLHLQGLKGIRKVDDEYNMKLEVVVKNEKNEIILQQKGIERSVSAKEPSTDVRFSIDCNMQHEGLEKMKALVRISDMNSNHSIIASVPFTMKKNENIIIESDGITATPVYLVNAKEGKIATSSRLPYHAQNKLIVGKLEGLTEKDGKVSYNSTTTALQPNGDTIAQIPYLTQGSGLLFKPEEIGFLPFNLNLNGAGNATFIVKIEDEFSDKSVTIKTDLQLH